MTALDAARAAKKASSGRCTCGGLQVLRPDVDSGIELYPHQAVGLSSHPKKSEVPYF